MPERTLDGCRILVVEDEYLLADDLRTGLDDAGALVLGPVATVDDALTLVGAEPRIDGAVLDVNLGGEPAYAVADLLIERHVPLVFTTGYDGTSLPSRFADIARCEKPTTIKLITQAIGRVIHD
ncbi:MAG: response regulator [Sphingomonas phyllosphaerae]|uniref:response regulator n=1 Tax=Sphingomonas phyllosphaerae TaxID=257003 RepID=UPI002FF6B932